MTSLLHALLLINLATHVRVTLGGHVHDVEKEMRIQNGEKMGHHQGQGHGSLPPREPEAPREARKLTFLVSARY